MKHDLPDKSRLGNLAAMVRISQSAGGNHPHQRKSASKSKGNSAIPPQDQEIDSPTDPLVIPPHTSPKQVSLPPEASDSTTRKRRLIAMFCRLIGDQVREGNVAPKIAEPMSPRQRQTLELLLAGKSEKEIAARLQISRHTVHVYVKAIYRQFEVCSRAELLARWVK